MTYSSRISQMSRNQDIYGMESPDHTYYHTAIKSFLLALRCI